MSPVIQLAAETEDHNPLLPASYDLLWSAVCFIVILVFFMKYVWPRMKQIEAVRIENIEAKIDKAETDRAEAAALLEQYRAQLAEARQEASRLREEARAQGAAILAETRDQAQAESARILQAAHAQIEADRQQAFSELRTQVGSIATDLAGRIIGESLQDSAVQGRVVDRFLADLEAGATGAAGASVSAGER